MKNIMASILVLTYGQEKYIAEALDSILMQKTKYTYEVIVGEDASPDHTREILQQYEKRYPSIFTMVYKNINSADTNTPYGIDLVYMASGKYIIVLEGDDFWLSEDKLERQIVFLEEHPDYAAVAHNCLIVDQNSLPTGERYPECSDHEYTFRHFRRNILPGQTTTILYRAAFYKQILADEIWHLNPFPGDRIIILGAIAKGPIYCIQEKMSAYRHITSEGTSYSANVSQCFAKQIKWHKMAVDFSRRLNSREAEIAAEGRYLATIFFDGLLKKKSTFRQAYDLYQYIDHKFLILIIKSTDLIIRKVSIVMHKIENALYWYHEWKRYMDVYRKCRPLRKYILDSNSRQILQLREKYIAHPDMETFINDITKTGVEFTIPELEPYSSSHGKIIVCTTAEDSTSIKRLHYTQILLTHSAWRNRFACVRLSKDFHIHADDIIVPVWGVDEPNISIINQKYKGAQLHIPLYAEVLLGGMGNQYFDVFSPCKDEIVIDCGAYDGTTELQIAEWSNYTYKKIYALEPNLANCQKCAHFYKEHALQNIELIQKGSWSEDTLLSFSIDQDQSGAGGKIGHGTEAIPVTTIDHIIGQEKVTFIKMDVEGAELESLRGAAETIRRDTPRLAICIYHKFEDLWEIPEYILGLNNRYRFYLRHYTSYIYETVLYAVAK